MCPGLNQHHPLSLPHPGPGKYVQHFVCVSTMPSTGHTVVSPPSWNLSFYQMFGDYENNYLIVTVMFLLWLSNVASMGMQV